MHIDIFEIRPHEKIGIDLKPKVSFTNFWKFFEKLKNPKYNFGRKKPQFFRRPNFNIESKVIAYDFGPLNGISWWCSIQAS